jgi:tetratricopeptide (TPR) repeat protein
MTRSIRSSARVASLLLLLVPAPAQAEDAEEAKLHFDKAQTAYKLGKFDEAIRSYEAAYRALSDPAFLFNIAQSHRQQYTIDKKVEHIHKALLFYKNYLKDMPQAANRSSVLKLVEDLKALVAAMEDRNRDSTKPGLLVLRGDSATGASVTIDGKVIGTAPLSHSVTPGAHLVQISREGYAPWSSSVTVAAGSQMEVPVILQPVGGSGSAPRSRPVYKKWWFWTVIAGVAVVAAGAGTGIYFATRGESASTMPQLDLR